MYMYGTILLAMILKIIFVKTQNYYLIIKGHNTETI